ncbi:MAG: class I SAM-dependent methyltransferase [Halioglobus sp.]
MQHGRTDILPLLESWYARENGQYLLESTRTAIQDSLDTAFGYHILQLGLSGGRPLCQGSPINHRIYCAQHSAEGIGLIAEPDEIPLESDSVDAIIAHHCLEFAAYPHQVLREIQRVLRPQGQLLVVGFNPYSLLGCKLALRKAIRDPLWSHYQPVSEHRLTDWLHLLGCEVLDTFRLYGVPPVGSGRLRRAMVYADRWAAQHNLPLAGLYILHATKQVVGLHRPRRILLSRGRRLIGLVPNPTPAPTPTPRSPHEKPDKRRKKGNVAA